MISAVSSDNLYVLLHYASQAPEGCFVEVGVWRGGTAFHLQEMRTLFAYDTFEGMPFAEEEDYHPVGDFSDTDYSLVKRLLNRSTVVKGIFPNSAVEMPPVAFAHIDCDQYKSIYDSAKYLSDKMATGGIMYFDDYGYSHLPLATKAVDDLFGDRVEVIENGKAIVRF